MSLSMKVDGEWRTVSDAEHTAMLLADLRAAGVDPCERCFGAKTNGVCGSCRMLDLLTADPDWRAMSDARDRLDFAEFGPDYTHEDQKADERTVAAFERKAARAEVDAKTEPNACLHCRAPQRGHSQRWTPGVGFHAYAAPTDEIRLRRLYARRAARLNLPLWSRSLTPARDIERTH